MNKKTEGELLEIGRRYIGQQCRHGHNAHYTVDKVELVRVDEKSSISVRAYGKKHGLEWVAAVLSGTAMFPVGSTDFLEETLESQIEKARRLIKRGRARHMDSSASISILPGSTIEIDQSSDIVFIRLPCEDRYRVSVLSDERKPEIVESKPEKGEFLAVWRDGEGTLHASHRNQLYPEHAVFIV